MENRGLKENIYIYFGGTGSKPIIREHAPPKPTLGGPHFSIFTVYLKKNCEKFFVNSVKSHVCHFKNP